MPIIDNSETDVDLIQSRSIASRGQATLCVELGIVNQQRFISGAVAANTGGGGGAVAGAGVLNALTGGTSSGGAGCPTLSQFIRVRSDLNRPIPTLVKYVETGMYLWSPISHEFEQVIYTEDIEADIWEVRSSTIYAEGSDSHKIITVSNAKGLALKHCKVGLHVPSDDGETVLDNLRFLGRDTVRMIETMGPTHIYCAGSSSDKMFWWHNLKRPGDD